MEEISSKARNKMAAIYGVLTGIFYIIVTTAAYQNVSNQILFYCLKIGGYVLFFVLMGILTARIKKMNGGYLEFKKAFGAIFIMVLISGVLYFIYNYIYIEYLDKQYIYRYKVAVIAFMEQHKMPDDTINKTAAGFDKQIAESKTFNLGNNVMSFCSSILFDSLFGLIVAMIVKKNKPAFE